MSDKTVLVTGATGFIGSHILDYLLNREDIIKIYILSRRNLKINKNDKDVKEFLVDLTNFDKLKDILNKIEVSVVINSVGKLGGPLVKESDLLNANYITVKNLVDIYTSLCNIDQFIHLSSFGVLGPIPRDKIPADETYPYNPSNAYERSKMLAEKYIINSDVPYTILRPEFVYGPRDMHVLQLFKKIIERKFILINGGSSYLHPTYIKDIINVVEKVLLNKKAIGKIFNIGGERYITVKEFAETVYHVYHGNPYSFKSIPSYCLYPIAYLGEFLKLLGIEFPLNIQRLKFFTENRVVDFKKAERLLGYRPYPLEAGLKETIRWYRENGYL